MFALYTKFVQNHIFGSIQYKTGIYTMIFFVKSGEHDKYKKNTIERVRRREKHANLYVKIFKGTPSIVKSRTVAPCLMSNKALDDSIISGIVDGYYYILCFVNKSVLLS